LPGIISAANNYTNTSPLGLIKRNASSFSDGDIYNDEITFPFPLIEIFHSENFFNESADEFDKSSLENLKTSLVLEPLSEKVLVFKFPSFPLDSDEILDIGDQMETNNNRKLLAHFFDDLDMPNDENIKRLFKLLDTISSFIALTWFNPSSSSVGTLPLDAAVKQRLLKNIQKEEGEVTSSGKKDKEETAEKGKTKIEENIITLKKNKNNNEMNEEELVKHYIMVLKQRKFNLKYSLKSLVNEIYLDDENDNNEDDDIPKPISEESSSSIIPSPPPNRTVTKLLSSPAVLSKYLSHYSVSLYTPVEFNFVAQSAVPLKTVLSLPDSRIFFRNLTVDNPPVHIVKEEKLIEKSVEPLGLNALLPSRMSTNSFEMENKPKSVYLVNFYITILRPTIQQQNVFKIAPQLSTMIGRLTDIYSTSSQYGNIDDINVLRKEFYPDEILDESGSVEKKKAEHSIASGPILSDSHILYVSPAVRKTSLILDEAEKIIEKDEKDIGERKKMKKVEENKKRNMTVMNGGFSFEKSVLYDNLKVMENAKKTEVLWSGLMNAFEIPMLINSNGSNNDSENYKRIIRPVGRKPFEEEGEGEEEEEQEEKEEDIGYISAVNGVILTFLVPGEFEVKCDIGIIKRDIKKNVFKPDLLVNHDSTDIYEDTIIHRETKTIQLYVMGDEDTNLMYL
jgi:hypothetical protein